MALNTRTSFTYGHTINDDNQYINFSEDGLTELTATIEVGSYYLNQFTDKIALALNSIGDNNYVVTLDRTTRKFTITGDNAFSLLVTTGTQLSISAFSLMGFTIDKSGSNAYEADEASGNLFTPQYYLKDFQDFDNNQKPTQSKVNETTDASYVESIIYGKKYLMECNIKYATDITGQMAIEDNPAGVSDLRSFMEYAVQKKPMEFMPDRDNLLSFTPCILEKATGSNDGTSFMLKEMYTQKLANYYETGKLTFRKINS